MSKVMWQPSTERAEASQMNQFRLFVNKKYGMELDNYRDLYNWSVNEITPFWEAVWSFGKPVVSKDYQQVVDDDSKMPGAKWFSGARLNFAENLLRRRDNHTAILSRGEGKYDRKISYNELYSEVEKMAAALREAGVEQNDRVAGFLPNIPEAVVAMLGAASLGAVWSSSSPDFGIKGVLDRFRQIEPKVLFAADGYQYNGKRINSLDKLKDILTELPSVEKVVVVPFESENPDLSGINKGVLYGEFLPAEAPPLEFAQLPFDHPLYIMYSSGTTGLPKSIVHGAGGTLLQHMKELRLHGDISDRETVFYFTTCGWMMWNWLVSNLALGATIVLYDGSPFYPDPSAMWQMAEELGITVFGTSAKFIAACEGYGLVPKERHNLSLIKTILSTGSPLVEESYDYVYTSIKEDVQLSSITGGTDIVSSFAGGNAMLPVYRGEIQCRALGMKVESFDDAGKPLINLKGELVCTRAFPSVPVNFWNDPDGSKFHNAYFSDYPGVWTHGDYILINDHGGVIVFGRSDATLNPAGVRIGTAEIYRVVEAFPEIEDSLAVGQQWEGDERVILFVKMNEGEQFGEELKMKLMDAIRSGCSPRHVPAKTVPVPDIPYTINGKKVEIAVKKILHGSEALNKDALANPESLLFFSDLEALRD
ncbi:MAG: acetoacetate--CoA ligase [Candidatus Marinimicrobia bacterium]|nr:acetoacetate--CoA ligase [Candidatus Neomarinimicrobiota bacterium]MDP7060544.1 acetoacetate--CoA ligase [Candidatus Neomarinimicrobiota bacterium]